MRKRFTLNLGAIICVTIATYCLYILLLDSILPLSIRSVLMSLGHISKHSHIFTIGFIPVYIGLMVFGTSLCAFYAGSYLQQFITRLFNRKPHYPTTCKNDAIHLVRKSPSQIQSKVS